MSALSGLAALPQPLYAIASSYAEASDLLTKAGASVHTRGESWALHGTTITYIPAHSLVEEFPDKGSILLLSIEEAPVRRATEFHTAGFTVIQVVDDVLDESEQKGGAHGFAGLLYFIGLLCIALGIGLELGLAAGIVAFGAVLMLSGWTYLYTHTGGDPDAG